MGVTMARPGLRGVIAARAAARSLACAIGLCVAVEPAWAQIRIADVRPIVAPPLYEAPLRRAEPNLGTAGDVSATAPAKQYDVAPIPNMDIATPRGVVVAKGASVRPGVFSTSSTYRGEGFIPGSTPQGPQQAKRMPMPGISLKVPLN